MRKRKYHKRKGWSSNWPVVALLLLSFLLVCLFTNAQICNSGVPSYTINMTGKSDSVWTSPSVSRNGTCCSVSGNNNCIQFVLTLDSKAAGVKVEIVGGGSGSTYYHINCTDSGLLGGNPKCVSGTGPFYITVCKPGTNAQQYKISSIPSVYPTARAFLTPGCRAKLQVFNLVKSSITWTGVSGYTSNLTCTSGCDTTSVKYTSGLPSYIDYRVCGTPSNSCAGSSYCDTVRVLVVTALSVSVSPSSPKICYGQSTVSVTATASGGQGPYHYSWSNGATTQTVNLGAGTYTVTVSDSTACTKSATFTVGTYPQFTANAGSDATICASTTMVALSGSVSGTTTGRWSGGSGSFIPNDSSLNASYVLASSEQTAGTIPLVLSTTNTHGCSIGRDTMLIVVRGLPSPAISGTGSVCENDAGLTYSTAAHSGNTYSWTIAGGTINQGQNTNSIKVSWGASGSGSLSVTETDSNGCQKTVISSITKYARPPASGINHY